jgi:hypothetical protein
VTEGTEPSIVYLDVDDEITSAVARLRRTEGNQVVFVLPYGSRLATSRINFRLLAREAASRDKHLEVVAADASARALAGSAGLAVHASVAAFEGRDAPTRIGGVEPAAGAASSGVAGGGGAGAGGAGAGTPATGVAGGAPGPGWPVAAVVPPAVGDGTETRILTIPRTGGEPVPIVGRRRQLVRPRTAVAVVLVLLLLAGAGGLAAFLYLPSATIVLHPASQTLGPLNLSVQARTNIASPDPASLVVPAHQFSYDLQASQTFTTTGKKLSETAATGDVTFENRDPTSSTLIPAGKVVSTQSDVKFATVSPIRIPRAKLHGLTIVPSTGSVAVEAVVPGLAGNVAADTITVIPPGYDPTFLKVDNPQPTSGGTHTESPQVSQQDVDGAMATLQQGLRDDLAAQIVQATGVPSGTSLLESTSKVGAATPSVDPTTLVGQAIATFDLGLTATGTVIGVDTGPVQVVAAQKLAEGVTSGWQLVDGSTSIDVGRPSVSGDTITFPVTAVAREAHAVDKAALLAQLKGLDLPRARALLDAYGKVDITLWPDWVTTIPGDTSRISFTIDAGPLPSGTPGPASS